MKERLKIMICLFVIVFCYACFPAHIFAADSDYLRPKKTVRVGVTELTGFSETDEEGNRVGILYDFFAEISKYANWKVEYVDCAMQEAVDMLSRGEVDIVGGISRNESTESMFDFPEMPNGYIYTTIMSKADRSDYIPHDFDTFDGLRLGIYANASKRRAELDAFSKNNNLNFVPVLYDSYEDYIKCLERGEVDAILALNTDLKDDEKILARFAPNPYYFAVSKGENEIVRELNHALEMVNTFEPDFNTKLYTKYFEKNSGTMEFSRSEMQYIQSDPEVTVVCMTNWRPFSYSGKKGENYKGITIDVLREIGDFTGLKFNYVGVDNFNDAIQMLMEGEADLFCGAFNPEYLKRKHRFLLAVPYLDAQTVMVRKGKDEREPSVEKGDKAALTYGFETPFTFESSETLYYNSSDESISAVRNGTVSYTLVSYLALESYIRRNGEGDLSATPISNANMDFTFAYRPDISSYLVSVIDKAIYSLNNSDMQSIVLENTVKDYQVTFNSYLYANPYQVIGAVAVLCFVAILVVVLVMRMRVKYLKKTALVGEAYRLVGDIANEYLFEFNFDSRELKLPDAFCHITGVPSVLKEDTCGEGLKQLFNYFSSSDLKAYSTQDFECVLPNGKTESFRAVCTVLFDEKKQPIRGMGKILNYQAEAMEKKELEKKANTDGLTGFYTKNYFVSVIEEFLKTAPPDRLIALIMLDLDYFKQVNDTIGHMGGDEVLKFLSKHIHAIKGEDMMCGRFGGDEFFFLVKKVESIESLSITLEELCKYFDRDFTFGDKKCHISISIGAVVRLAGDQTVSKLLHVSDQALYQTKLNGRNGFVVLE